MSRPVYVLGTKMCCNDEMMCSAFSFVEATVSALIWNEVSLNRTLCWLFTGIWLCFGCVQLEPPDDLKYNLKSWWMRNKEAKRYDKPVVSAVVLRQFWSADVLQPSNLIWLDQLSFQPGFDRWIKLLHSRNRCSPQCHEGKIVWSLIAVLNMQRVDIRGRLYWLHDEFR